MITIRYADLPEGLHAQAERRGKRTVIYLRPGLTAEERRRSLRRARQSARMGYGPRLPAAGVAQAVARDIARATLGNMAAVLRRHPVASFLLAGVLAAMLTCYVLFVTGPLRLMFHASLPPGPPGAPRHGAGLRHADHDSRTGPAGSPGWSPSLPVNQRLQGRARPRPAPGHPPATPSPSPSPSPTPAPSRLPSPSPSPSGLCLNLAPLGCLPG